LLKIKAKGMDLRRIIVSQEVDGDHAQRWKKCIEVLGDCVEK